MRCASRTGGDRVQCELDHGHPIDPRKKLSHRNGNTRWYDEDQLTLRGRLSAKWVELITDIGTGSTFPHAGSDLHLLFNMPVDSPVGQDCLNLTKAVDEMLAMFPHLEGSFILSVRMSAAEQILIWVFG